MSKQRLDFIDFAKGFANLSIVIFHYSQPYTTGMWSKAIMVGGTGVHLFFILSGFNLGLSSTKMESFIFYRKRFTKILIPYYLTISSIFLINEVYPIYRESSLYAIGGHFFFYKMFDERIMGSFGYHFWFISTIVQFYIAFPFIVKVKNKLSTNKFIILSILISLAYWVLISVFSISHLRVCNSFFLQYLWEFNIGIVLAEKYVNNGEIFWNQRSYVLGLISISGIGLMALMVLKGGRLGQTFNDIPASIGYLGLVSFIYLNFSNIPKLVNGFTYIGKISYELYLTHMLIFKLVNELILNSLFSTSNIITSLFIVLPISIIFARCYLSLIDSVNNYLKPK